MLDAAGRWGPQPGPQTDAIQARSISELFYGGAAGGGKSDFLLGDFLQDVPNYGAAWKGILFRRTYGELQALLTRSQEIYPQTGARFNEKWHRWEWPNGARLRMAYLEIDKDKTRYQGHDFTWIGWDELTQWPTDDAYRYLRARLRSAYGVPVMRIRAAANPGGVGHNWVKSYFVSYAPGGFAPRLDPKTGMRRVFIPAKLWDNKILLASDPGYEGRLRGLGSEAQVKAWLLGDWDIIEGAFFDCWSPKMVLRPTALPKDWPRFRSADWGSYSPFSVGWWAICQDDWDHPGGRTIPRGALIRYREWYGTKDPADGGQKGLKLTAEQFATGIIAREEDDPTLSYAVLDPSTFKEDGGPSIAERVNTKLQKAGKTAFRRADNTRVPRMDSQDRRGPMGGWDQLRARMLGVRRVPMIYCFTNCVASIRTIPVLQHDPARPEDLNTRSEDHAADDWRYAALSRPFIRHVEEKTPDADAYVDAQEEFIRDSILTL